MAKKVYEETNIAAIAEKIREKTGGDETYTTKEMPSGIDAVYEAGKGAGGGSPVIEKDVNFYDYDGTLLYSYTLEEIQTLTELPALPTREGLICQEWNWTLAELKALGRPMTVGATYITDDGATRLYLDIPNDARKTVPLHFSQSVANGVTINWGDGSATETISGTGYVTASHTYAEGGEYMISLMPSDSCNIILGNGSDTSVVGAKNVDADYHKGSLLKSSNIGKNVTLGVFAFVRSAALEKISMPSTTPAGTAGYASSCFYYCHSLRFVVLSRANTILGHRLFSEAKGLALVSLPPTLKQGSEYSFGYSASLRRVDCPDGLSYICFADFRGCTSLTHINFSIATSISERGFQDCVSLKKVTVPEGQTSLTFCFAGCYTLSEIDIPSTIKTIGANAFSNCYGMTKYDFTKLKDVPTLSNTNAFSGIPADCVIEVPDILLDAWKAATNWSTYASHIKGESEV